MATIPGSHFSASASAIAFPGGVNVVETSTGTALPAAIPTDFNLEVYTGPPSGAPSMPFSGYQGLAVLGPDGHTIDLVSGAYAVTDNGSGDTLIADGTNETISGGANFVNLILNGSNNVANGGGVGGDFIEVNGIGDTVNGGLGPEAINVSTGGNTINAGSGADTITASGNNNVIAGGSGADTINAFGSGDTINGGSGPDFIEGFGDHSVVNGGSGNDTINAFANNDTINGGSGTDTINVYGNNDTVIGGSGPSTVTLTGNGDTVTAGSGDMNIGAYNGNFTFNDTATLYADTIVGFNQTAGDRIHLTTDTPANAVANSALVNGGQDTLITLSDHSTILLKGVNHIDTGFFG